MAAFRNGLKNFCTESKPNGMKIYKTLLQKEQNLQPYESNTNDNISNIPSQPPIANDNYEISCNSLIALKPEQCMNTLTDICLLPAAPSKTIEINNIRSPNFNGLLDPLDRRFLQTVKCLPTKLKFISHRKNKSVKSYNGTNEIRNNKNDLKDSLKLLHALTSSNIAEPANRDKNDHCENNKLTVLKLLTGVRINGIKCNKYSIIKRKYHTVKNNCVFHHNTVKQKTSLKPVKKQMDTNSVTQIDTTDDVTRLGSINCTEKKCNLQQLGLCIMKRKSIRNGYHKRSNQINTKPKSSTEIGELSKGTSHIYDQSDTPALCGKDFAKWCNLKSFYNINNIDYAKKICSPKWLSCVMIGAGKSPVNNGVCIKNDILARYKSLEQHSSLGQKVQKNKKDLRKDIIHSLETNLSKYAYMPISRQESSSVKIPNKRTNSFQSGIIYRRLAKSHIHQVTRTKSTTATENHDSTNGVQNKNEATLTASRKTKRNVDVTTNDVKQLEKSISEHEVQTNLTTGIPMGKTTESCTAASSSQPMKEEIRQANNLSKGVANLTASNNLVKCLVSGVLNSKFQENLKEQDTTELKPLPENTKYSGSLIQAVTVKEEGLNRPLEDKHMSGDVADRDNGMLNNLQMLNYTNNYRKTNKLNDARRKYYNYDSKAVKMSDSLPESRSGPVFGTDIRRKFKPQRHNNTCLKYIKNGNYKSNTSANRLKESILSMDVYLETESRNINKKDELPYKGKEMLNTDKIVDNLWKFYNSYDKSKNEIESTENSNYSSETRPMKSSSKNENVDYIARNSKLQPVPKNTEIEQDQSYAMSTRRQMLKFYQTMNTNLTKSLLERSEIGSTEISNDGSETQPMKSPPNSKNVDYSVRDGKTQSVPKNTKIEQHQANSMSNNRQNMVKLCQMANSNLKTSLLKRSEIESTEKSNDDSETQSMKRLPNIENVDYIARNVKLQSVPNTTEVKWYQSNSPPKRSQTAKFYQMINSDFKNSQQERRMKYEKENDVLSLALKKSFNTAENYKSQLRNDALQPNVLHTDSARRFGTRKERTIFNNSRVQNIQNNEPFDIHPVDKPITDSEKDYEYTTEQSQINLTGDKTTPKASSNIDSKLQALFGNLTHQNMIGGVEKAENVVANTNDFRKVERNNRYSSQNNVIKTFIQNITLDASNKIKQESGNDETSFDIGQKQTKLFDNAFKGIERARSHYIYKDICKESRKPPRNKTLKKIATKTLKRNRKVKHNKQVIHTRSQMTDMTSFTSPESNKSVETPMSTVVENHELTEQNADLKPAKTSNSIYTVPFNKPKTDKAELTNAKGYNKFKEIYHKNMYKQKKGANKVLHRFNVHVRKMLYGNKSSKFSLPAQTLTHRNLLRPAKTRKGGAGFADDLTSAFKRRKRFLEGRYRKNHYGNTDSLSVPNITNTDVRIFSGAKHDKTELIYFSNSNARDAWQEKGLWANQNTSPLSWNENDFTFISDPLKQHIYNISDDQFGTINNKNVPENDSKPRWKLKKKEHNNRIKTTSDNCYLRRTESDGLQYKKRTGLSENTLKRDNESRYHPYVKISSERLNSGENTGPLMNFMTDSQVEQTEWKGTTSNDLKSSGAKYRFMRHNNELNSLDKRGVKQDVNLVRTKLKVTTDDDFNPFRPVDTDTHAAHKLHEAQELNYYGEDVRDVLLKRSRIDLTNTLNKTAVKTNTTPFQSSRHANALCKANKDLTKLQQLSRYHLRNKKRNQDNRSSNNAQKSIFELKNNIIVRKGQSKNLEASVLASCKHLPKARNNNNYKTHETNSRNSVNAQYTKNLRHYVFNQSARNNNQPQSQFGLQNKNKRFQTDLDTMASVNETLNENYSEHLPKPVMNFEGEPGNVVNRSYLSIPPVKIIGQANETFFGNPARYEGASLRDKISDSMYELYVRYKRYLTRDERTSSAGH